MGVIWDSRATIGFEYPQDGSESGGDLAKVVGKCLSETQMYQIDNLLETQVYQWDTFVFSVAFG